MDELSPIFRSLSDQPLGFLSGFVAGLLRMNLTEDPARGWLTSQLRREADTAASDTFTSSTNGGAQGPRSIAID